MKFDSNKIAHEHIYRDQASVLAQIGLIDSKRLPITGIEQIERLLKVSNKQNEIGRWP
jgi:carboxymethylenebutenolidase